MTHRPHNRVHKIGFNWPEPPFGIVLVEPQIPPNTGNIARLCAATGSVLHLVGPLGFRLDDRSLRRAGLDYWEAVTVERHPDTELFFRQNRGTARLLYFSTGGSHSYFEAEYQPGDRLVFGSETEGLPDNLLAANPDHVYAIPQRPAAVRSLNLATAVGIVLYEALRQQTGVCQPESSEFKSHYKADSARNPIEPQIDEQ